MLGTLGVAPELISGEAYTELYTPVTFSHRGASRRRAILCLIDDAAIDPVAQAWREQASPQRRQCAASSSPQMDSEQRPLEASRMHIAAARWRAVRQGYPPPPPPPPHAPRAKLGRLPPSTPSVAEHIGHRVTKITGSGVSQAASPIAQAQPRATSATTAVASSGLPPARGASAPMSTAARACSSAAKGEGKVGSRDWRCAVTARRPASACANSAALAAPATCAREHGERQQAGQSDERPGRGQGGALLAGRGPARQGQDPALTLPAALHPADQPTLSPWHPAPAPAPRPPPPQFGRPTGCRTARRCPAVRSTREKRVWGQHT